MHEVGRVCRNIAVLAIGQYWQPQITEESIVDAANEAAEEPEDDGQGLRDTSSVDSMLSAGAEDLEDRSAHMQDDMPLLKAHGTKHSIAAGAGSVLQDSKKQENLKPDRLVHGQSLAAQPKPAGKAEALSAAGKATKTAR